MKLSANILRYHIDNLKYATLQYWPKVLEIGLCCYECYPTGLYQNQDLFDQIWLGLLSFQMRDNPQS